MNITSIVQELRAESDRLERAIIAVLGIGSDGATRRTAAKRTRARMSAAARKRISLARKKWWAERKRAAKPRIVGRKSAKPTAAKKAAAKGGITAAGRKRLSENMKKRWAERKKAKAATA
jgi:hypothetical protein